jgi:hypothetical protein
MKRSIVHSGVAACLGAAFAALAAAALFATPPIASADETDFALPALVPPDEFTSEFTIGEGATEVTYTTTWDGTGLPTTTMSTDTLPTGTDAFGFSDESTSVFSIGTTSFETQFESVLFETTSAAGNQFEFVSPLLEFFSPAI